jgi:peptidoglycan biosynthesis protein MviN/MurJ (putative lipid II flippase)
MWQVIMISLPRTLALATDKIVIAVLVAMASYLAAGSIAIFNLAFNLQSVPLAIVAVSYSTAAFPTLSQMFKRGEKQEFVDKLATALRHIIFWSIPATVFFIVLRAQIVRVILGAKKFSWTDTRIAAAALALFTVSLLAQGLVLLFVRAYYAGGKTFKPFIINASTSVLAIIFAIIFKQLFEHWPLFHFFFLSLLRVDNVAIATVLMLAWAYSLNNLVNAWLLWINFERDFGFLPSNVVRSLFECFSASVIGGFFAYLVLDLTGRLVSLNSFLAIFTQGLVAGIVGLIVWYLVLRAIGNPELREIYGQLHSRIWRGQRIIAEENV